MSRKPDKSDKMLAESMEYRLRDLYDYAQELSEVQGKTVSRLEFSELADTVKELACWVREINRRTSPKPLNTVVCRQTRPKQPK